MHDIPLAQLFALNACHASGEGLEPAGENYEDQDMIREVQRIMAGKS